MFARFRKSDFGDFHQDPPWYGTCFNGNAYKGVPGETNENSGAITSYGHPKGIGQDSAPTDFENGESPYCYTQGTWMGRAIVRPTGSIYANFNINRSFMTKSLLEIGRFRSQGRSPRWSSPWIPSSPQVAWRRSSRLPQRLPSGSSRGPTSASCSTQHHPAHECEHEQVPISARVCDGLSDRSGRTATNIHRLSS
jgi:hypothetical protein